MKAFVHDLRFALRMLARSPGFTLAVVVLLALGLGANTTILNLVNAVLVRPIPGINPLSYPDYADYRDRNSVFSGLAAYSQVAFNLSSEGVTERIPGAVVSGSYFQVLGVDASAGRTFMPEEDRVPGRDAVAVTGG